MRQARVRQTIHESACTTALQALHIATSMIQTGQYKNVLVVNSCTYSRNADIRDTLSWFLADGAGAFVVGPVPGRAGFLGFKSHHTAGNCEAFHHDVTGDPDKPTIWMHTGRRSNELTRSFFIGGQTGVGEQRHRQLNRYSIWVGLPVTLE